MEKQYRDEETRTWEGKEGGKDSLAMKNKEVTLS